MDTSKEIRLSSSWEILKMYGACIFLMFAIPTTIIASLEYEFNILMFILGAIYLMIIGLLSYSFKYACEAKIVDDKIVLKKQFRPRKEFSFDRIGEISSFQLNRTKYITFQILNDKNVYENYLIINTRPFLSFDNNNIEQVLLNLRNLGYKRIETPPIN